MPSSARRSLHVGSSHARAAAVVVEVALALRARQMPRRTASGNVDATEHCVRSRRPRRGQREISAVNEIVTPDAKKGTAVDDDADAAIEHRIVVA